MTRSKVEINGTNGFIAVDHEDGTYTVCLDDNTVYFATAEEIGVVEDTAIKVEAVNSPDTKLGNIFKAVQESNSFSVKVPKGKGSEKIIKDCFIREFQKWDGRYNNMSYFLVEESASGKVHWVNIRAINVSSHLFSFNAGHYKEQVLEQMKKYL